ncbi:unnamed protein product [Cylicocyclus nassatus]|uniref:Uncharacterized protein n=1 Tax=Cylicocyclus nassatus TaxID=53992 RepID=A0AA36GN27_CYLNA|nr:unnamed protein product [Cylicocyclus nassatus]
MIRLKMQTFLTILLILSTAQFVCSNPFKEIYKCYKDWSRCTPATEIFTGVLWKDCEDRCRYCLGRESGECVEADGGICSGGYQCQCTGGGVEKSNNLLVKLTCLAGL